MFTIKRDTADALRLRIHFLRYEAHVDLLEGISFFAAVNLAILFVSNTATLGGLPTHSFDFALQFAPSRVWFTTLIALSIGMLFASLLDRKRARCAIQLVTTLVFAAYVGLVLCKTIWLPSPRDYMIFGAFSCLSFFRLKREIGQASKARNKPYTAYAFSRRFGVNQKHS